MSSSSTAAYITSSIRRTESRSWKRSPPCLSTTSRIAISTSCSALTAAQRTWRADMPLVRVELFERRLTPELESRLIDRLTDALVETLEAPELKSHPWVIVEGH